MECKDAKGNEKRARRRKKSFIEALKEKYYVEDESMFSFIIVSPKRRSNTGDLAHLHAIALNEMDVTRADIPRQGLTTICPNVVDLDLANNLLEKWSELLQILSHLPKLKFVNVSRNRLRLDENDSLPVTKLSVENLALNDTGMPIGEVIRLSHFIPHLKELHICDNNYESLANIEQSIKDGAFSSLECLRLNNNDLSNWSEVWKLRHLPHLKFLILSGNPMSNTFYDPEDCAEERVAHPPVTDKREESFANTLQPDRSPGPSDFDASQVSEDESNGCDQDRMTGLDKNGDFEDMFIDNIDNGGEEEDEDEAEVEWDELGELERPVSRFDRHAESECSSSYSSSEQDEGSDEATSSQAYDIFSMSPSDSLANTNFNNSGRRDYLYDDDVCGRFNTDLFGPLYSDFLVSESTNGEASGNDFEDNDETEDWHRVAAEAFLFDIIDNLSFDEGPSTQSEAGLRTGLTDADSPNASGGGSENTHNSDSLRNSTVPSSSASADAESSATKEISESESILKLKELSITDSEQNDVCHSTQMSDTEDSIAFENSPYTEQDFIPRAISMLDDQDLTTYFQSHIPAPPRPRAQRSLFQEAVLNSSNNNSSNDEPEKVNEKVTTSGSHSESDSCSDCEAEKYYSEKGGPDFGVDALRISNAVNSTSGAAFVSSFCVSEQSTSNTTAATSVCESSQVQSASCHGNTSTAETATSSRPSCSCGEVKMQSSDCTTKSNTNDQLPESQEQHHQHHYHHHSHHHHQTDDDLHNPDSQPKPFQHLQMLCLSSANLHHWDHLKAFMSFPKLNNIRLKNNPLYSSVNPDDRRKLYIASLPKVTILNGSEVSQQEREKAERHYLRYFMDRDDKPEFYQTLVKKHGPPVKLVDIDLSAGYQEWANLKFVCKGVEEFTSKIHLVEPVGKLRILIARKLGLPKGCFIMYHHSCGPSHPESERELIELRCESLPMSRFDFAEGDEIHIDVRD